jgi:hypothetical protein
MIWMRLADANEYVMDIDSDDVELGLEMEEWDDTL